MQEDTLTASDLQNQDAVHVTADAAGRPPSHAGDQDQLIADTEALLPVSSVPSQSPMFLAEAPASAMAATFSNLHAAAEYETAETDGKAQHRMPAGSILSPRASLDLTLHPDDEGMCVVRITAQPERAQHPSSLSQDTLIEDPTAVAVLEHAFQPNTTHPVFHVHMPSRRNSQHGHETASEADLESDHMHQTPFNDHQLSSPLLGSTAERQSPGEAAQAVEQAVGVWPRWKQLLGNPEAVPFFAMSLLMGFGTGILSVYLFLYLDELGE